MPKERNCKGYIFLVQLFLLHTVFVTKTNEVTKQTLSQVMFRIGPCLLQRSKMTTKLYCKRYHSFSVRFIKKKTLCYNFILSSYLVKNSTNISWNNEELESKLSRNIFGKDG